MTDTVTYNTHKMHISHLTWFVWCGQYKKPRAVRGPSAGAGTPVEIKKSKSRAGGTAGAAVHPKTTDPTSWEVELPW
jgi:hypothetical protein